MDLEHVVQRSLRIAQLLRGRIAAEDPLRGMHQAPQQRPEHLVLEQDLDSNRFRQRSHRRISSLACVHSRIVPIRMALGLQRLAQAMLDCGCNAIHQRQRIVLTGGPGAGKTAVLELARSMLCRHLRVLPESASIL
ncbi:MAG: hypothetical protein ACM3PC_07910, partial [Deltaproteobacteria bacterium]